MELLLSGQSHFSPWENHGASNFGTRFSAPEGEESDGNSQHGFPKDKLCLKNVIAVCNKVTGCKGRERVVDVNYLNFSTAFNTVD